eukprot:TRINITY_DN79986_c0_g1_i1.p1 TRINITY_DN79986_c0_g1~~TRINITY_DN79986_c0_g1_i1.p1  ORF type:complete len:441 (+),score=33.81 TRINITY_DN79986_c0_g1_i1:227-1549(+)
MISLRISDFSCIDSAEIVLSDLTVIIGPQASGKSLVARLLKFFIDLPPNMVFAAIRGEKLREWTDFADFLFCQSFSPGAWGDKSFLIEFEAGKFRVTLKRNLKKENGRKAIDISYSSYAVDFYSNLSSIASEIKEIEAKEGNDNAPLEYVAFASVRRFAIRNLTADLGADYVSRQLFIPAGRSFFTSMGKAINAFIESESVDLETVEFGRRYIEAREFAKARRFGRDDGRSTFLGSSVFQSLYRGTLHFDKDIEYLKTEDNRTIPISMLSSGQQELYPLLLTLESFIGRVKVRSKIRHEELLFPPANSLVYIEEAEAHLFPPAQSVMAEFFARIVARKQLGTRMFLTTHSPYILAKLNNLVKAGAIKAQYGSKITKRLEGVVSSGAQLSPGTVSAYAIIDRNACSITIDGMIDSAYLDRVTDDITNEFSELLDMEMSHGN